MQILNRQIVFKVIIILTIPITTYSQNINGTYRRNLKCTGCSETLVIKSGENYERKIDLDWGGPEYKGKYLLTKDTLILTDDSISKEDIIAKNF